VGKVDLHIHTTASDGRFSPEEIIRKSAGLGMSTIAITDHDTIDGITPALEVARDFPQLTVIPGVEISTDTPGGEVHMLGYFIDYRDSELKAALERFRHSRMIRAQGMIAKLVNLGVDINWQRVKEIAGDGSVGRPHIAQAMLEKGYIKSFGEAFTKYIGYGGIAYVERYKMTPEESVKLVLQAKGLPVLAHPFTVEESEAVIIMLKSAGLVGIEAYYKEYTAEKTRKLVSLAEKYDLIVTGGTDYHGLDDDSEVMIGGADVPVESAERLKALAKPPALQS
jgi:predicted metal-dependent phosphoesterase TrpH